MVPKIPKILWTFFLQYVIFFLQTTKTFYSLLFLLVKTDKLLKKAHNIFGTIEKFSTTWNRQLLTKLWILWWCSKIAHYLKIDHLSSQGFRLDFSCSETYFHWLPFLEERFSLKFQYISENFLHMRVF